MADSRNETTERHDGMPSGNNNPLLESIFVGMAEFFGKPEIRESWSERTALEVPNDVALQRFQKFKPPTFNGEGGVDEAERWIEGIEKTSEDCQVKLRRLQNSKEKGPKNWMNTVGSSTQRMGRRSQKRLGNSSHKQPQNQRRELNANRKEISLKCRHCGRFDHRTRECWKKIKKCIKCGSSKHQIGKCPRLERNPKPEPQTDV